MAAIETPCIKVCAVDPAARLCRGCGRTIEEIARWTAYDDRRRAEVMRSLESRLAGLAHKPMSGVA
ncbi:MAG: DUF1289 domain-containing protein [Pseudorhodoplanes sp.]